MLYCAGDSKLDPNDPRNAALLEVTKVLFCSKCTYILRNVRIGICNRIAGCGIWDK